MTSSSHDLTHPQVEVEMYFPLEISLRVTSVPDAVKCGDTADSS